MDINNYVQHHRKAVLLLSVGLCVAGYACYLHLPVAIFPDLNAPRIIVTADAGDTPIPTVLANITLPLENAISGVPGVSTLKSLTAQGGDEIDVNFAWGSNMESAMQLVNAKIAQIQPTLPANATIQAERLNPSVFPIMGYSLYSNTLSMVELRHDAQFVLRPRLLHLPGVQQVTVMGGDTPEFLVKVSPDSLTARNVSITDIETALSKSNEISDSGYYEESYQRHDILVDGQFRSPDDIASVTVAVRNGVPVTVRQVATVSEENETRTIEASGDGNDAVLMDIIKQPSGNTVQIAKAVTAAMSEAKRSLPYGVTLSNYYDQSQIVQESQASVLEAIIVGGILALVVLILFLGNLRAAAIVLTILPLTIIITFVLMQLLGQSLNIMTLGALAIALGLVIDDGIVVVENIVHEIEQGKGRPEAISAGLQAITPAMIGSSVTTMAAFLPLTFLSDLTGQFFGPLAIVMIAALTTSLVLSLVIAPLLAAYLLPSKIGDKKRQHNDTDTKNPSRLTQALEFFPQRIKILASVYAKVLRWSLEHRAITFLVLVPVGVLACLTLVNLPTGFFPEFDEGGFILDYQLPDGTSLEASSAIARKIETVLSATPEIAAWSRRTGAQLGFDITTQNVGDMSIRLRSNRRRSIESVMDDVRNQVDGKYPQAQADFHQILQDNIGDIAGSPSPVEIKIFGPDQVELEALAQKVDEIITKVPGVVDDFNGIVHTGPQTIVRVNSMESQRYGLTADDIAQAAQAGLQGVVSTTVQQGEQSIGVRVQLDHSNSESNEDALGNLAVSSPINGNMIRLSQVADISFQPGAAQIKRENQRQMIAVTADLSNRDLGSATRDIQATIAKNLAVPSGYSIKYGGLFESQQQSFSELGSVLAIAALLVFALLVFQFRSYRQATAVLFAALFSLSGVLFALYLTLTPLNISSFTGAIMIVGIITENGIVLFDCFNQLRIMYPNEDLEPLMISAGAQRLRPILMTTIGAVLALFPLALGIGAGAALQKPLAIAVIGGLCVSIVFTLIVAPTIYLSLEVKKKI